MVRRRRVVQALRLLSLAAVGLALGGIAAECYTWLRTARFGGPSVFDIYRALGIKLPHSAWAGISKLILWVLVQPIGLIGSMVLIAVALVLHVLMMLVRRSEWSTALPVSDKQILLLPAAPLAVVDPVIARIKEAYRRIDALKECAPSAPQGHGEV